MTTKGIDIAWDRPTVTAIKATGAHWVARYLSPDKTKNLTAAEVHDYVAAGLAVVTVWESTAGRALQSFYAGQQDAQGAEAQRKALGLPGDHVIYFAVDTDTNWTSVWPYFQGVLSVLPIARTGVYGGIKVINGAHAQGLRYLWQTVAWSAGAWSAHATIRQPGGTVLDGAADVDYAQSPDFGQYPRPITPPEDDMPYSPAQLHDIVKAACTEAVASQPARDAVAIADLWWLDHALTGTVPPGASAAQSALVLSIHEHIKDLGAPPAPTK